jgi:uncharacterized protein with NRDE domain
MCLIAFAIGVSERWPLMIAANRDEFLDRPTLPLARWQTPSGQEVLSGRDLRAGGTWMGITPGGRIAFLTNVRGARADAGARSRGELVTRWLESRDDAAGFVAALEDDGADYAGFNLVLGDFQRNAWMWTTNRPSNPGTAGWQAKHLPLGVYGLSNASLDTPWPKTVELKRVLATALNSADDETLQASLWAALANRQRAQHEHPPSTGVPPTREEALSSAFVDFPEYAYGTRCSTVLLATAQSGPKGAQCWSVLLEEQTHLPCVTVAGEPLAVPSIHRYLIPWQQTAS